MSNNDQDPEDGAPDIFLPLLGLAGLAALGFGAALWLRGRVTDPGVAHTLTLFAFLSAPVCLVWLVAAWWFRPGKR